MLAYIFFFLYFWTSSSQLYRHVLFFIVISQRCKENNDNYYFLLIIGKNKILLNQVQVSNTKNKIIRESINVYVFKSESDLRSLVF